MALNIVICSNALIMDSHLFPDYHILQSILDTTTPCRLDDLGFLQSLPRQPLSRMLSHPNKLQNIRHCFQILHLCPSSWYSDNNNPQRHKQQSSLLPVQLPYDKPYRM
uniref:Uncharacterized protein n=1 Tax=Siphoviridae sp. ctoOf8 TaxID=2825668 RepID=A0A8S5QEX4_9CAUD|nr:MAG TPA: hypothetical protein [Siphoviridae sp. ctoOf8]